LARKEVCEVTHQAIDEAFNVRRKVLAWVGLPVFAIASLDEDELGGRHRDSANVDVVEAGWASH
jgi:hypothetical protein